MEKTIIIKQSLVAMSVVCRVCYRENAKLFAELLNENAKKSGSDVRYYIYELNEDY